MKHLKFKESLPTIQYLSKTMMFSVLSMLALILVVSCSDDDNNEKQPSLKTVKMFVPHEGSQNFQFMNFWVAQGLGLFEQQGIDLEITVAETQGSFIKEGADVAIIPNPSFLNQVANGAPLMAFANTFKNDPANLILRKSIADTKGLSLDMTIKDRLIGLRGLKVGVAKGPKKRLIKMFQTEGLNANDIIDIVEVEGHNQNSAFENDEIDAIFVHTPYLEHAILNQGAILLVHNSQGEPAELSELNIHLMVTTKNYLNTNEDVIQGIANAICAAQQIIKSDKQRTIQAIQNSGMTMNEPDTIGVIYDIYVDAIPDSPAFFDSWERGITISAIKPNLPVPVTPELAETHVERRFTEENLTCE